MSLNASKKRAVSGMRPTGRMHLGNYHGALKNWLALQHKYDCFFFVADFHALTTHYEGTENITSDSWTMLQDWLAVGLDPNECNMFIQSSITEHAELHLLLSMITSLSWLERIPTYKDQREKLTEKDLSTYGFLGYPLLQSADVLVYKADLVPIGEDQLAHLDFTRDLARRFNFLFARESGFEEKAELVIKKLGKKLAKLFRVDLKKYQEHGDLDALAGAKEILQNSVNLSIDESNRLYGYLEGKGKIILPEPEPLLTKIAKMPGLDGQKMSKSYNNTISIVEKTKTIETKIKTMPTDPARVRRTDPGDPNKCPVWDLHKIYSSEETKDWVQHGCTTAGIGCLNCKGPLIDSIEAEIAPIRDRSEEYSNNIALVKKIEQQSAEKARYIAKDTLQEVRCAMGIGR